MRGLYNGFKLLPIGLVSAGIIQNKEAIRLNLIRINDVVTRFDLLRS